MKFKINKKVLLIISIILLMIIIDQLIKIYVSNNIYNSSITLINGFLNLTYVENTGGAFGIGNNNIVFFIIVNIIIIGVLVKLLISKKEEINTITLISISLIIAGGMGNLIDRIFRAHVIDYIDITPIIKYPIFNFADICVVFGIALIIVDLIYRSKNERI
ncbi:MAG: signal peptidase II [Clostridia bacterium]|nr:signal peptidase II [Clostridia bacterium]